MIVTDRKCWNAILSLTFQGWISSFGNFLPFKFGRPGFCVPAVAKCVGFHHPPHSTFNLTGAQK